MNRYEQYKEESRQRLIQAGFPESITGDQALMILEPSDAPENFYCDGEINHTQALARWKRNLRNSGLTETLVRKAHKYIFG
jgi:hypothetical protein